MYYLRTKIMNLSWFLELIDPHRRYKKSRLGEKFPLKSRNLIDWSSDPKWHNSRLIERLKNTHRFILMKTISFRFLFPGRNDFSLPIHVVNPSTLLLSIYFCLLLWYPIHYLRSKVIHFRSHQINNGPSGARKGQKTVGETAAQWEDKGVTGARTSH